MSIKRNIFANYVSQLYVALIGILLIPVQVRYMGAEAYGLVGFFVMLQTWFQMLDMGLSPTLSRETARFAAGASEAARLRKFLRVLETIFVCVGLCAFVAMFVLSEVIATKWLNVRQLPIDQVVDSLRLIAAIVALRWMAGLYRGAVSGFERLVWLSTLNTLIATARFVLVIPLFILVGATPRIFFWYQLLVAIVELLVLISLTYKLMPSAATSDCELLSLRNLSEPLRFSLGIAFTSSVWVFVTQTDKLILSKILPLTDYAFFTLAVLVASGIMIISGPISTALLPRLTKLSSLGSEADFVALYRKATQFVAVTAIPVALVLGLFSEQVLFAWSGNPEIGQKAAPVLRLYALGNGVLVLAAFPYYLQFAKGDLKLHLLGNAIFVIFLIPSLIWSTWRFGMVGAGFAWAVSNLIYFLVWVPLVHARFVRGLHIKWLLDDIGIILITTGCVAFILSTLVHWPLGRIESAVYLIVLGTILVAVAATSSRIVRSSLRKRFNCESEV